MASVHVLNRLKLLLRLTVCALLISVVCFLPAAQAAKAKDWNIYCITGGDCAMYDPTVCGDQPAPAEDAANVGSIDISEIVKKYGLQSAVIQELGGKVLADSNADKPPASPASTLKLVIADTVLQEKVDPNKTIRVTNELLYNGDDENISSITVRDALKKMLGISSNVSANVLMKSLGGPEAFSQKAQGLGYKETDVTAYYSDAALGKNKSSIGDQAQAMSRIFTENGDDYNLAKTALKGAEDHYGVGGLARKWAGNTLVAGDVGLFESNGSQYIVGVYYEGNYTSSKAVSAVKGSTADLVTKIGNSGGTVSGEAVGNIPAAGKDVGASWYEGEDGKYGHLPGTYSYAELGDETAMGGLKEKQKLAISYKGKTVVAEKLDIGLGGGDVDGKPRAIDLYVKTAKYLGITSAGVGVVHVQGVDASTPLGPITRAELNPTGGDESGESPTCCPTTGQTTGAGKSESDHGTWNSGLQPPYILEQWAIETLKDVAAKMKVDEADAVTQEHVTALVAFAIGEGGDIMNSDLYNPLNTGLDAPELIDGAHSVSGVQAFKSFDAGVEATARTMVGSYQDRLADVLTQPQTTAKQFMYALTYFNKYPGNALWAEASTSDPAGYYQERLNLVNQVRSDYKGTAGLVIGTPAFEQQENKTQPSLLQFTGGGGEAATTGGGLCGDLSSGTADAIAQTAVELAWPDESHGTKPKPEYQVAIDKYNKGMNPADCGVFVATVVRASGADPDYPGVGTSVQEEYVRSHPEKYDVVDKVNSVSDLQPGDILIVNQGGGSGANGHTFIYVGKQKGGFDAASASLDSRAGNLGDTVLSDSRGNYLRARLK